MVGVGKTVQYPERIERISPGARLETRHLTLGHWRVPWRDVGVICGVSQRVFGTIASVLAGFSCLPARLLWNFQLLCVRLPKHRTLFA